MTQLARLGLNGFVSSGDDGALHVQIIFNGPLGTPEASADAQCQVGEFVFGSCTSQPSAVPFASVSSVNETTPNRCDRDGIWFIESGTGATVVDEGIRWILFLVIGNINYAGGDGEAWAQSFDQAYRDGNQLALTALANAAGQWLAQANVGADEIAIIQNMLSSMPAASLYLLRGPNTRNRDISVTDPSKSSNVETLRGTPGWFTLAWPHDYAQFFSTSLFYWDQQRMFYVETQAPVSAIRQIGNLEKVSPDVINRIVGQFLPRLQPQDMVHVIR